MIYREKVEREAWVKSRIGKVRVNKGEEGKEKKKWTKTRKVIKQVDLNKDKKDKRKMKLIEKRIWNINQINK